MCTSPNLVLTFCRRLLTYKSLFITTYHICCQIYNGKNPFPANHSFLSYGPTDTSQYRSQPVLCQIHHASWKNSWILSGRTNVKKNQKYLWLIIFCQIRITKMHWFWATSAWYLAPQGMCQDPVFWKPWSTSATKNMIFMKFNILAVWNHMMLFSEMSRLLVVIMLWSAQRSMIVFAFQIINLG